MVSRDLARCTQLTRTAHFHASHLAPVIAFFSAQNESTRLSHSQIQPRRDLIAVLLATYLAYSGFKKRSLSLSGAVAAFVVGYASLSSTICSFGAMLIVFYLSGSKATKVGVKLLSLHSHSTQTRSNTTSRRSSRMAMTARSLAV